MRPKDEAAIAVGVAKLSVLFMEIDGRNRVAIDSCFTNPTDKVNYIATLSVRPMTAEELQSQPPCKTLFVSRRIEGKQ